MEWHEKTFKNCLLNDFKMIQKKKKKKEKLVYSLKHNKFAQVFARNKKGCSCLYSIEIKERETKKAHLPPHHSDYNRQYNT